MLHDFDFDNIGEDLTVIGQFSYLNRSVLHFLLKIHASDIEFYYTGSRFLKSDLVTDNTDYDFFTNHDSHEVRNFLYEINYSSKGKDYRFSANRRGYYGAVSRWKSTTSPAIDIFSLTDENFESYKKANYELKNDEKKAKEISKEERIKFYDERTGINLRRVTRL